MKTEVATFGGGCFWGVEEVFRVLPGVVSTSVGYMGGKVENPTYESVCTDKTGHAEVVHIEFKPDLITYSDLLKNFFSIHNPTELNKQGPDVGTQYRSVIFFHSSAQEQLARQYRDDLTQLKIYEEPIVTEILPATHFFRAEEYHQQYLTKRGLSVCHF